MIPRDWQRRLKIDSAWHLRARLIKEEKKSERILDVKHIKDTQGKETETFARLTTYHKQKMPQSESFSFVRADAY